MKGQNTLVNDALSSLPVGFTIGLLYKKLTLAIFLISLGFGLIAMSMGCNLLISNIVVSATMIVLVYMRRSEGFNTNTEAKEISNTIRKMKVSGASLIEGFEDEKETKKHGKPAPATPKKETLASPFVLGEIPKQVKDGPHIDVNSTLMSAIKSLNPEQINAMTKDTQALIETQKSLMGMLGTMKPMMNDGKELMETFQQMFGNQ